MLIICSKVTRCTPGRTRTGIDITTRQILSLMRLPISPQKHSTQDRTRTCTSLEHWFLRPARLLFRHLGICREDWIRTSGTVTSSALAVRCFRPLSHFSIGGPIQVRTGVAAFAELSLTTRPQDHLHISQESNLQPSVLETAALPVAPEMYSFYALSKNMYRKVHFSIHIEEGVRFELTDPWGPPVFKTGAIGRALPTFLLCRRRDSNPQSHQTPDLQSGQNLQLQASALCGATWYRTRILGFSVPRIDHLCYSSKKNPGGVDSGIS